MLLFPEIYYEGLFALLYVMAITFIIIVFIINQKNRWPQPKEVAVAATIAFVIMAVVLGLKVFHII